MQYPTWYTAGHYAIGQATLAEAVVLPARAGGRPPINIDGGGANIYIGPPHI